MPPNQQITQKQAQGMNRMQRRSLAKGNKLRAGFIKGSNKPFVYNIFQSKEKQKWITQ